MERAIGKITNHTIAKSPLPLSMSCKANQIVMVGALLMNSQSVLIPQPTMAESDVDEYLDCYYESDSDETDSEQYIQCIVFIVQFI